MRPATQLTLAAGLVTTLTATLATTLAAGPVTTTAAERWYSEEQVTRGGPLYQAHCARCHRRDASGTADWRTPGPDGTYPPPPLDGSAHTWHHPLPILRRTVALGNARLGGVMPGFGDKLDAGQIDAILAWVQSRWSDETYHKWLEISRRSSQTLTPAD